MRFDVTIRFSVDPKNYIGVENNIHAVRELAFAMLAHRADFPMLIEENPADALHVLVEEAR